MLKLLKKEFLLAMHPITPMMLLLSAMVLIPNYPYVVIFFYVSMAIFFTCLLGRETNDIVYSVSLPVSKRSVVKARFLFAVIVELLQLTIMVPLTVLSQRITPAGNLAGMDPGVALFGLGFIVSGLFNAVFFSGYYKDVNKVGVSFLKASVLLFICAALDVVSTYAVGFVRDRLDTMGTEFLTDKLIFLAVGVLIYAALTLFTYKLSVKNFEKQDLN